MNNTNSMLIMRQKILLEVIVLLFIILFLCTGISKLMDHQEFREQIATSPVLRPFARWIARLLPLTEVGVSVALFVPRGHLQGLYVSIALMVIFTGYIIATLRFSEHIPGSCRGVFELLSWKANIVFNGIFIALAATGIILHRNLHQLKTAGTNSF